MAKFIAVDIGNTRVKWGRWDTAGSLAMSSLPAQDTRSWDRQREFWGVGPETRWAIASVNAANLERFLDWLGSPKGGIDHIQGHDRLPLTIEVDRPESVGIDRLLNAVGLKDRLTGEGPAVVVDVGTAVTVDRIGTDGAFQGGAILPGFRLMATSLHEHTSGLPMVELCGPVAASPGRDTESAIRAGVFWAVVGAVRTLSDGYGADSAVALFVTGGDGGLLAPDLGERFRYHPALTLEGIRIAAGEGDT